VAPASYGVIAKHAALKLGQFRVADDEAALPAHHFVEAQVLEMAAVGQIDVRTLIRGESEGFGQKALRGKPWTVRLIGRVAGLAGIAEPPAQPDVKQ